MKDNLDELKCGTRSQYFKHLKTGTSPCTPCREANNAYNREYKLRNLEKLTTQRKKWQENNSEYLKVKNAEYYQQNKDIIAKRVREYQVANPEKRAIWSKTYAVSHPEEHRARVIAWKKANTDKVRESKRRSQHKRNALKLGNGHETYTEEQLLETYGVDCHICESPVNLEAPRKSGLAGWELGLHVDHLIPLSKGGPNTLENVRPAHGLCNVKKHNLYEE
jgi:5-methylcytosine-specific restriction endonuclease McrA